MSDIVNGHGFEEVVHTADRAIKVWGKDYSQLFEAAARGMIGLMDLESGGDEAIERMIGLEAMDLESLLVAYLSEILFLSDCEQAVFERFDVTIEAVRDGWLLKGEAAGWVARGYRNMIKAVTYHLLEIRQNEQGFETMIVFDV